MRLASYNVENLFDRAKAMNLADPADGDATLADFAALSVLINQVVYSDADKTEMVRLLTTLGLAKSDTGPFALLRRNRGQLVKRGAAGLTITANGRSDWVGGLELRRTPIPAEAMRNTARAIHGVGADVLGIVEVENRPVLRDFMTEVVPAVGGTPFAHLMVIDGNDERGIDVGLCSRAGFPIGTMRSHVDDADDNGRLIFSRDCPEYCVTTPAGNRLILLVNHLKSKSGPNQRGNNARRLLQARRVAEIYNGLIAAGETNIAVLGDLNDTPAAAPLAPLFTDTDLTDAQTHPNFDDGGFPGTYGSATAAHKIDYILLSPALFAKVQGGGIYRRGMWPGVRPKKWAVFPELKRPEDAASDHAAVFVDLDL
ncbi:endonuclease/exonuclease/phosphatase [alpha proteobacterium AAP81b]|nr:endonuclease/exonuclease/phosphatase [alpha proteobacterium AAP81b]